MFVWKREFLIKKKKQTIPKWKKKEVKIQILKPRFSAGEFSWGVQITVILSTSLQALA